MSQQEIAQIELTIDQANSAIDMAKALERLHKNRDFKKVILERYLKDEAIRLVNLKGDPNCQDEKVQKGILKEIDGIGSLRGFFGVIYQQADIAERAIESSEEALAELRGEE